MSATEYKYGYDHRVARRAYADLVASGFAVCARCGREIALDGEPCPVCHRTSCGWDLGHDDRDPERYSGPEHTCCNPKAGGAKGNAKMRKKLRDSPEKSPYFFGEGGIWSRRW